MPDKLTREEYRRLADDYTRRWQAAEVRAAGMNVAEGASLEELGRLWRILRLRKKGRAISDSAKIDEVTDAETRMRGVWHFFTKVAGVTHANRDGSDRQEIIAGCEPFETLDLDREEDNPVDANAVAVRRRSGEQLGYLTAELAADVVERLGRGYRYGIYLAEVTGGHGHKRTLGANLMIVVAEPGVGDDVVLEYINGVIATDEALLDDLGVDSVEAVRRTSD